MHAPEIEDQIIGTLLAYPQECAAYLSEHILPGMFSEHNRLVFVAVQTLVVTEGTATFMSVMALLREGGNGERCGGPSRLNELWVNAAPSVILPSLCAKLRDVHAKREVLRIAAEISASASGLASDIGIVLSDALAALERIAEGRILKTSPTIKQLTIQAVTDIQKRATGETKGISTGIAALDRVTGGIRPSSQWIVAGPAKGGKSSMAITFLESLAVANAKRCAFFGLEMPSVENVERLLCHDGQFSASRSRDGTLSAHEMNNLHASSGRIAASPIHFRDDIFDIASLIATARRLLSAYPDLFAIFVDYAQLVDSQGSGDNREREVAMVSRLLRKFGMQTGVVVILLSQTNDDGKLRESRALGMDATKILTLDFDQSPTVRKVKLIQRDGMSGIELRLAYIGENFKFGELFEDEPEEPQPKKRSWHK